MTTSTSNTSTPRGVDTEYLNARPRVLWATGLQRDRLLLTLQNGLKSHDAVVVRADLQHKTWNERHLSLLRGWGGPVWAYVRGPHYNFKAVAGDGFEWEQKQLVEKNGAILRHIAGRVMLHPAGYDAYINMSLVPLRAYAQLVADLVWKGSPYTGILIDGLTTKQIYCLDPAHADYGKLTGDYQAISHQQYIALKAWVKMIMFLAPGVQIIGNGAWEPNLIRLKERPPGNRWEYAAMPPSIQHSSWVEIIHGTMDESLTHPYYHNGSPFQQAPKLSQTLDMHVRCAQTWLAKGKMYWVGGEMKNIGKLPESIAVIN